MIVYIQNHTSGAGHWIYNGYAKAWQNQGYEPIFIDFLGQIDTKQDYMLMITNSMITESNIEHIEKSKHCFLYASPNTYPQPWGSHPNFQCPLNEKIIKILNNLNNITKWTFGEVKQEHYTIWEDVKTIPLAFDNLSYKIADPEATNYEYDVCFVGGFANNGYNEKAKIMQTCLTPFSKGGFKCAFSVGQNISHESENEVLIKSKICLNIHDAYQRTLKLDANERTFKCLGINGLMISDENDQLSKYFPDVKTSNDYETYYNYALYYMDQDVREIKKKNIDNIAKNHTYISRVKQFLEYAI